MKNEKKSSKISEGLQTSLLIGIARFADFSMEVHDILTEN
jgi:hypothetical protein